MMANKPKQKRKQLKLVFSATRAVVCLILLGLLLGAYFLVPRWFPLTGTADIELDDVPSLVWHTVDVGQGDCTIVQFPDNKVLMVDAGKPAAYDTIVEYLATWQITRIDWFVITHPDDDHYGSAPKLLSNEDLAFDVLYYTNFAKANNTYNALIENYAFQVPENGEKIAGENYLMTFVSPFDSDMSRVKDSNDSSLMMTIEYYNKIFVLTGDASSAMDDIFIEHARELGIFDYKTDKQIILKVAHHGSRTGSSNTFLEFIFNTVAPGKNFALISCAETQAYGHPHQETLTRLGNYVPEENIYVTKEVGGVVIQATATSLTINDTEVPLNTIAYSSIFIGIGVVIIVLCFYQFNTKTTRRK